MYIVADLILCRPKVIYFIYEYKDLVRISQRTWSASIRKKGGWFLYRFIARIAQIS